MDITVFRKVPLSSFSSALPSEQSMLISWTKDSLLLLYDSLSLGAELTPYDDMLLSASLEVDPSQSSPASLQLFGVGVSIAVAALPSLFNTIAGAIMFWAFVSLVVNDAQSTTDPLTIADAV